MSSYPGPSIFEEANIGTGTLAEQIKQFIQSAIVKGDLKPGELIVETMVADALKISRAPVREALRLLAAKGLVTIVPRKGAYVSKLSSSELRDINQVRIKLETMALELAFTNDSEELISEMEKNLEIQEGLVKQNRITEYFNENVKFHNIYIKRSNNAYLITLLQNIEDLVLRYRVSSMNLPGHLLKSFNDHRAIYQALVVNRLDKAVEQLANHLSFWGDIPID